MKRILKNLTAILLSGGGLIFAACSNFLEGSAFREQLEQEIEYINAQKCSIKIEQNTEKGAFLPSGSYIECKAGYSTELTFKLNKEYWYFKTLEAVSVLDENQTRSDCVDFEINKNESDEEKGIYKITLKLLKNVPDILVRPV
ncbi:MAG: hypothetical protein J5780_00815, partial [Treponema sp.]|nr:hypothetical protein [Treponema sp.]